MEIRIALQLVWSWLLFKGDDFARTDVLRVAQSGLDDLRGYRSVRRWETSAKPTTERPFQKSSWCRCVMLPDRA